MFYLSIHLDMKLTIHPSLSATQQVLRKKKLADNLNEKLSQRPGVLELVEDKILEPSNPDLVKALESLSTLDARSKTEETKISLTPPFSLSLSNDGNIFDQNFSDSYSPTQSPGDPNPNAEELPSQKSPSNLFSPPSIPPPPIIFSKQSKSNMPLSNGYSGKAPSPSQARKKQQKPKYRKLRYHEYLPPNKNNGKGGKTTPSKPPKLDTPYALLLQQQQLFLQLQVLQQQYPNGVLVQKLPELMKNMSPSLTEKAQALLKPKTAGMENSNHQITKTHEIPEDIKVHSPLGTGTVTVRLDELKVNNLKAACKEMNVIVSGKKVELIERLLEHNNGVLPATVLADLPKERRQSSFNQSLSFDSQQSTNASPQSPDPDPVFQYPGRNVSSQQMETSNSGMSSPSLPQVLPAIEFQQQVDRLCEKKKIDHFSSRGQKMIAPRPDLKQMVAIKLPYSSEGGSETGSQVLQNSRSLPSTPQQLSPVDSTENLIQELMEQSPMQPSSQQPVTSESLMLTSQFGSNPNLGTQYVTPRRSGRASLPNPPPYPGIQSQNFQQVEQITNQYMFQPHSSGMTHRSVSLSGPSSSHLQVNSMLPMTSESTQHISLGVKQTMGPPSEPPPFPTDDGIGFGELVEVRVLCYTIQHRNIAIWYCIVKTVQYSTVQYSTVQYSTVQYNYSTSTVQYNTVQYHILQYSTVQYKYSTVQYSTVSTVQSVQSTVQCSTVQYSTSTVQYKVQYSTVQYSTVPYITV